MLSAEHGSIEGKQIGHYHVLSRMGRGGMGEVFLSQDTRLGRKVALKLLRSDLTGNEDPTAALLTGGASCLSTQSPEHLDHLRNRFREQHSLHGH